MAIKLAVKRNGSLLLLLFLGSSMGKFNSHRVVRSYTGDPRDELYEDKMEAKRKLYQQIADEANPILAKLGD